MASAEEPANPGAEKSSTTNAQVVIDEISGHVAEQRQEESKVIGAEKLAGRERSQSRSTSSSSSSRGSSHHRSPDARSASAFDIDQRVEVFGFESAEGRILNGRIGIVIQYIRKTGRYEVKFGPDQTALIRPDRLRKAPANSSKFAVDDHVEVFGLTSDSGRALNGQRGFVVCQISSGRYEVKVGLGSTAAIKAENLRRFIIETPTAKPKAAGSLASLLGLGRVEEKKKLEEPKWQSIWDRSGTDGPTISLSTEEQDEISMLNEGEELRAKEVADIRKRVEDEFLQAGVYDLGMIEEAFKQQLDDHDLKKLLRSSDDAERPRSRSQRVSSSSSSSSSRAASRSRSRSRSR